jgi:hypothetical protein
MRGLLIKTENVKLARLLDVGITKMELILKNCNFNSKTILLAFHILGHQFHWCSF